jgi:hypothetical protein
MLFYRIQSTVAPILGRATTILNSNVVSNLIAAYAGYSLTKSYRDDEIAQLNRELKDATSKEELLTKNLNKKSNLLEAASSKILSLMMQNQGCNQNLQECSAKSVALSNDLQSSWCISRYSTHKALFRGRNMGSAESSNNPNNANGIPNNQQLES